MGVAVYISVLSAALSVCVVIFVMARDKNITKRLAILENVIEDLNQESHKLNKKVDPIAHSLKEAKKITEEYRAQKSPTKQIKERDYEASVLSLYREGKNESEIARILGISVSQIELILSFNNPQ